MEQWKQVVGYEGIYEVSSLGRVKSLERYVGAKGGGVRLNPSRILIAHADGGDYMHVGLYRGRKGKTTKVYKIVLEAFVGLCPEGQQCRHDNGIRGDNRLDNLCWGTRKENADDRVRHGTSPVGESNPKSKLTSLQVSNIYLRAKAGESFEVIAADFGISDITVSHIHCGRTWSHITGETLVCKRVSVTDDVLEAIQTMKIAGKSLAEITRELGVSRSTAWRYSYATVSGENLRS